MTTSTKTLKTRNLQEYLKTLSKSTLNELYNNPATCLAVFRELPDLSKSFILRILFINDPVPQIHVANWIPQPDHGRDNIELALEHKLASQCLIELAIWKEVTTNRGAVAFCLDKNFQKNYKIATLGGGEPWTKSCTLGTDPHHKDLDFLDKYALDRWESILQFMVQPIHEGPRSISKEAMRTLVDAKLIDRQEEKMEISSAGFQFLLLDTSSQVWFFILKYLENVRQRGLSLEPCLTFLFKLSFCTLGKDYSMDGFEDEILTFLQHLREFGLVYLRKRSSGRFYPTNLAINITAGKSKSLTDKTKIGNLVIETNYRIYAYTTSELEISLLSMFCEIECRFPNLVVCVITRGSVRKALLKGIGAEQIVSFLRQHGHPQMYKRGQVVPRTVADQIKLWEMERERIEYTEGVLYKDFMSTHDFSLLSNFASSRGVLVYSDERSRTMIVTKKGHPAIKQFWKEAQNKG